MILDQTSGAIQQMPTAHGWNAWTWSIVPGADVVVAPPDQPGIEHTLPENHMHHAAPANLLHHTLKENRMHYAVPREGNQ